MEGNERAASYRLDRHSDTLNNALFIVELNGTSPQRCCGRRRGDLIRRSDSCIAAVYKPNSANLAESDMSHCANSTIRNSPAGQSISDKSEKKKLQDRKQPLNIQLFFLLPSKCLFVLQLQTCRWIWMPRSPLRPINSLLLQRMVNPSFLSIFLSS